MEFGAHLPLVDLGSGYSLAGLKAYARAASALGYATLCANDHLLFGRPWLDGPTALAAVLEESGELTLATTVSLPVIRGPAQLAKTLAALDLLSGGRMVAGLGPGSSQADYEAAGVPFAERWPRFEESISALRSLLGAADAAAGRHYDTAGVDLQPPPGRRLPLWVASWGSPAGLRRVARLGEGWLASAYNTTPERFAACAALLPAGMPNAIATAWMFVTEDAGRAERVLTDLLSPMLRRPVEQLRELSLPIGPAEICAQRLAAFAAARAERVYVWPLADGLDQLELFQQRVVPLMAT